MLCGTPKDRISYFLYTTGIKLNMFSNIDKKKSPETLIITNNRQSQSCCIAATPCLHNFSFILIFIGVIVRFNVASWSSFKRYILHGKMPWMHPRYKPVLLLVLLGSISFEYRSFSLRFTTSMFFKPRVDAKGGSPHFF